MSQLTTSIPSGLVAPTPHRESRLAQALSGLGTWMKGHGLFSLRRTEEGLHSQSEPPLRLGARPMMAAAWYGSLGPGPMCLPGQPAIGFEPGYRD